MVQNVVDIILEILESESIHLIVGQHPNQEHGDSYNYAKTAYDQSKDLSAKYIHGSVCRLAIRHEFENQAKMFNDESRKVFDRLVNQEVMSNTTNMIASLCNCVAALYWIFMKTGEHGALA